MKNILLIFLISLLTIGCGGNKDNSSATKPTEDENFQVRDWQNERILWMEMEPVQCRGNAWQKDWLTREDSYPEGNPRIVEAAEKEIIIDYYAKQGIDVIEVDSRPFPENRMVCEACSCPQGYTLFLKIPESQAKTLAEMGFKRSERL